MKARLGEFYNSTALTISETRLLLGIVLDKRRNESKTGVIAETPTLTKTQDYLDLFARYKEQKTVQNVDDLLNPFMQTIFTNIERSQLGEWKIRNVYPGLKTANMSPKEVSALTVQKKPNTSSPALQTKSPTQTCKIYSMLC